MTQHWTIGGAFLHYELLTRLFNIIIYSDRSNYRFSVFDCPVGLQWAGGRNLLDMSYSNEDYLNMIEEYNRNGIGFNFTFSNRFVTKEHLDDKMCNYFLEHAHNKLNGVIVLSHELGSYIKERYPDYKMVYSVSHVNRKPDVEWYKEKLGLYDLVVFPPELAEKEFLVNFKDEIERIELLVNENCYYNCSFKPAHYKLIDRVNVEKNYDLSYYCDYFCLKNNNRIEEMDKEEILKLKDCRLSLKKFWELKELGISHWKLSGRKVQLQHIYSDLNFYLINELEINNVLWRLEASGVIPKNFRHPDRMMSKEMLLNRLDELV